MKRANTCTTCTPPFNERMYFKKTKAHKHLLVEGFQCLLDLLIYSGDQKLS